MNKKKTLLTVLLLLIICLTFSGCDFAITSVDSLIRPPKLSGENSLLQKAFEDSVDDINSIVMKTPLYGNNRSSFLLKDLNNDGCDEAIVFYSDPSVGDFVNMSLFNYKDNDWIYLSTIKGIGDEVVEINFADVNGDEISEILVSWAYTDKINSYIDTTFGYVGDKVVSLYNYENDVLNLLKTIPYTNIFSFDSNNDKKDEILLIDIDLSSEENRTTGKIISFNDDYSFETLKKFKLSNMIDILNISIDVKNIENNKYTRIFVDGTVNESAILTDIIVVDQSNSEISLPLESINSSDNPLTIRNNKIFCRDIDSDGLIEIPMTSVLPGSTELTSDDSSITPITLTSWKKIDDSYSFVDEFNCIYSTTNGYMVIFPDEWLDKITAVYNRTAETVDFYILDNLKFNKCFSVKAFPELEWNKDKADYSKISSSGTLIYGYKIFNDLINPEVIQNNFIIIT